MLANEDLSQLRGSIPLPSSKTMDQIKASIMKNEKKKKEKKKNVVKNLLENPFTLDWPTINIKHYKNVLQLLEDSLSCVSEEVKKLQNIEMSKKDVTKENRENIKIKKVGSQNVYFSQMVFGFNAVMRGLEKDQIVCLVVNSESRPSFLLKTFMPVCSLKSIPIIPIKGLTNIVRDFSLGIKSCLALGFKRSVCVKESLFYPLYCGMHEALEMEPPADSSSKTGKCSKEDAQLRLQTIKPKNTKKFKISKEKFKSFHLYRSSKIERVFKLNANNATQQVENKSIAKNTLPIKMSSSVLNLLCAIDSPENDNAYPNPGMEVEESCPKSDQVIGVRLNEIHEIKEKSNGDDQPKDLTKKREQIGSLNDTEYVPARVKKIKNNPSRKGSGKDIQL